MPAGPVDLRAVLWRTLAGCAIVAGAVAITGVLTGDLSETDGDIMATSFGFGVCAVLAALSASVEPRAGWRGLLALVGVGAACATFALLLLLVWSEANVEEAFAIAAILAVWCAHTALVVGSSRPEDSQLVRASGVVAVTALGVDASVAIAMLAGLLPNVRSDALARAFAALLILGIVAAILTPLLRIVQRAGEERPPAAADVTVTASAPIGLPTPDSRRRDRAGTVTAAWAGASPGARVAVAAWTIAPFAAFVLAFVLASEPAATSPSGPATGHGQRPAAAVPPSQPVPAVQPPASPPPAVQRAVRIRLDREARIAVRRLARLVDRCETRTRDFTRCIRADQLPGLGQSGVRLGAEAGSAYVSAASVATYAISGPSRSGNLFTLERNSIGERRRTCTDTANGACGADGTW